MTTKTENTSGSNLKPEEIARRAYQLWEQAGRPIGRSQENWRQAEAELRATRPASSSKSTPATPGAGPVRSAAPAVPITRPVDVSLPTIKTTVPPGRRGAGASSAPLRAKM